MIYENVEFFNVEKVESYDNGVILCRFPADAINDMSPWATRVSYAAMGCEVRLVCESKAFRITLGAVTQDVDVYVMRGDYFVDKYKISASQKMTLQFENRDLFTGYEKEALEKFDTRFSHNVWRFYFHSEGAAAFYECKALNGVVRPPQKEEIPQIKMLAYGSSITHWCWAMDSRNSYIQLVARKLNADVLNKGMAGACNLEYSTMDYLIGMKAWDVAFCELGINVINSYDCEEFKKRAEYLISGICKSMPENKVFLTGIYYAATLSTQIGEKARQFNCILSEIKEKYNLKNLIYIDSKEIMDSPTYLCKDLLHPSDYGHIMMGEKLANIVKNSIDL